MRHAADASKPRFSEAEIAQRLEELERARDRAQRCKALVAKLVVDFRHDATVAQVLRKVMVEKEDSLEECERLEQQIQSMRQCDD
jgi:ethanolamine utilization protein EutQ (cupin superfamily)